MTNWSYEKAYQENAVFINKNLIVNREFLVHFEKDQILTAQIIEDIEAQSPSTQRGTFITTIRKRTERGFKRFIQALDATGQRHVADLLDPKRQSKYWGERRPVPDTDVPDINPIDILPVDKAVAQGMIQSGEYYPFRSKCRGRAIIVNMEKFTGCHVVDRPGSSADASNLHRLYESLGFTVVTWTNLPRHELITKAYEEHMHPYHQSADAFILTMLSHGSSDRVLCSDGECLNLEELYRLFDNTNCPALVGKPKIFIIQAGDIGFPATREDRADFVIVRPGYMSYLHAPKGTFFIRALIYTFMEIGHIDDFQNILFQMNARLQNEDIVIGDTKVKATVVSMFTTTKKIHFLPGYFE